MKDRIRQLMEDQHLTQQNFAQMIGISTATLSNIFNGKTNPSLSIVECIIEFSSGKRLLGTLRYSSYVSEPGFPGWQRRGCC